MKGLRLGREKSGSSVGKKAPKPDKMIKQKNKAEKSTGLNSNEVAANAPQFVDAKCDKYDETLPHLQSKLLGCGLTFYLADADCPKHLLDNADDATGQIWGIVTTTQPRRANKLGGEEDHEELLETVAGKPGVCAVQTGVQYGKQPFGEAKPCCDAEYQKAAFSAHCRFALKYSLPLVLCIAPDCKDAKENARAIQDLKQWLEECKVPLDYKLYFSSWTGDVLPALALLKRYPNSIIGLNGAVSFRSNDHLREAAFDFPIDRLVLESDAPNNPPSEPLLPHSSWTVLAVAQCVAVQKKLAEDGGSNQSAGVLELLRQTNQTAAKFYNRTIQASPLPSSLKEDEEEQGQIAPLDKTEEEQVAAPKEDEVDLAELAKYLE